MTSTGFFTREQVQFKTRSSGRIHSCAACGLCKHVNTPCMKPFGNFRLGIMNVGEAPGETEDRRGKQWQGKMGRALQRMYADLGVDLFEDCININAVNCRPMDKEGNNRAPSPQEIANCRRYVLQVIEEYKPKVIVALGNSAMISLVGQHWKKDLGTITRWRGWTIPDRIYNAWLCCTFHPSFKERGEEEIETIMRQDLERALAMRDVPFPKYKDEEKRIEIVTDLSFLPDLKGPLAFDYETTGIKPHNTSLHRIVCMSVCNSAKKSFTFMIPRETKRLKYIRAMLLNNEPKIAQNMKFEDTWTYNIFGYRVRNWFWDPMLATHVLDNRADICGLKFQTYVNFGIADYDSEVAPYLAAKDKKNANAVNQIAELIKTESGRRKLLIYCGMDSLFEYRLAMRQMKLLEEE